MPAWVPRFTQRDSAQLSQRDRTCFSSSCAMLLEALKPGTLKGANGDDHYLEVEQRFGDTTDASAQLRALTYCGVTARLVQNADFQLLKQQINRGIPVPCGYIHRRPVDRLTGSGHWLIVYDHTPSHVVVNDPWGEPLLISGATLNANGMGLHFSLLNFGKRWMVEPIGGGTYRVCTRQRVEHRCRQSHLKPEGRLAPGPLQSEDLLTSDLRWDRSRRCAALGADHHGHPVHWLLCCRLTVLPAGRGSVPTVGILRQSHRINPAGPCRPAATAHLD
jgi:hypothetical protein